MAQVTVVGTDVEPCRDGPIERERGVDVHELVLVAQVFVFGCIGSCEIDASTERQSLPQVDTDGAREVVSVLMGLTRIGQRVFDDIEGVALRCNENRPRHVV